MSWLLQGNDPKWAKQPVKPVEENKEDQPWYKKHELVITSVSGGLLAGIALYVFGK
jgi:hypothetical protein